MRWWLLLGTLTGLLPLPAVADGPTALLGAFPAEVEILRDAITDASDTRILDHLFTTGQLDGCSVVVAETGVGKVNAAMTTTLLIEHFHPREVIFTGIAGGVNMDLHPGDLVIGGECVHHDFVHLTEAGPEAMATRNPNTGLRNPIRFTADSRLLRLARRAAETAQFEPSLPDRTPQVIVGVIATGDAFVASAAKKQELRERLDADAVEMEGAAVMQICHQTGTLCLVVRSLSDNADARAAEDLQRFYRIAAANSARLVRALLAQLATTPE